MTTLLTSNDYTDKDFASVRARLISNIKSVFPTWTDLQVADLGVALLDSFAFTADILGYNLDLATREAKWGTATQLRSIIRLAKLIGFSPKGASAATTTETISATSLLANCTIPAGSVIKTGGNNPTSFQTLADVTLTPSSLTATVDVENSLSTAETYLATTDPSQTYQLGQTPYLDGSIIITSVQGTWTKVDNFLSSRPSDLHFMLAVDASDRATVTFGDGNSGVLPIGSVTFTYKTGGGTVGQVGPNTINDLQGAFYDTLGNRVNLVVTNPAATVGAEDKESVATIKVEAPASIRQGNRTVSRADFETVARTASGVGRALMLTKNEDSLVDPNTGQLWIVPAGLGFLTPTLRSNIAAKFALYPYAPSFILDVMDPEYLDVDIVATVFLQGTAKSSVVGSAIRSNLQAWFALSTTDALGNSVDNPTSNFGFYNQDAGGIPLGSLAYSDLFNVVRDTPGVRKVGALPSQFLLTSHKTTTTSSTVVQNSVHDDLLITNRQFPRFLTITLNDGDHPGVTF